MKRTIAITLTLAWLCGCGGGREVSVITPERGLIEESFTEPAQTRLANVYPITMPVDGRVARIDFEPGDIVTKGQPLAVFDLTPFEQAVAEAQASVAELKARIAVKTDNSLEDIALEQAVKSVEAMGDTLKAAAAQIEAEQARVDRAAKELARKEKLVSDGGVTQSQLDDAQLEADTSLIELRKQQLRHAAYTTLHVITNLGPRAVRQYMSREKLELKTLSYQLAQAEARLALAEHRLSLASIVSPIDGVILERDEQGDDTLTAGMRLLLLGDLGEMEVVADVLTQDALRLRPGSEVILDPGVVEPVAGKVKRIEPLAFTKLSSLGVEQQRVNVIVSLEGSRDGLEVGYRVQARFLTGRREDALVVPRFSVLQDVDQTYYVFKVVSGVLSKAPVELGLRGDMTLEVTSGLSDKDTIIATPDATMKDGEKVK